MLRKWISKTIPKRDDREKNPKKGFDSLSSRLPKMKAGSWSVPDPEAYTFPPLAKLLIAA